MNKYDDHPTSFKTKWLIEGTASSFDYLYIEQYYSQNKFSLNQTIVDSAATQNPSIFENYGNANKDINSASSSFLVLVWAKGLQLAGHSESKAFRLMCKDFMQANPNKKTGQMYFRPHLICQSVIFILGLVAISLLSTLFYLALLWL